MKNSNLLKKKGKNNMKSLIKVLISASLILSIIFSIGVPAFAVESDSEIISSAVHFSGEASAVYAKAFVRNYTSDTEAMLVLAVYEGNKLIDVKYDTGINAVLKAGPVDASAAGITLKAFVWTAGSLKVISNIATYDLTFEAALEGLVIKQNDEEVSLDSFTLNADGIYEKNVNILSGQPFPVVTASNTGNNGLAVNVINEANKSTIIAEYGMVTDSTKTFSSTDFHSLSKTNSRTYVINFNTSKDNTVIYSDEVVEAANTINGTAGSSSDTDRNAQLDNIYYKDFKLNEEETIKEIKFTVSGQNRTTAVIIKPLDSDKKAEEVIVNNEGNIYNPTDDTSDGLVASWTYNKSEKTLTKSNGKLLKNAAKMKIGEKKEQSRNVYLDYVEQKKNVNQDGTITYTTGARQFSNAYQYVNSDSIIPEAIKGGAYMIYGTTDQSSNVLTGEVTYSFNVNADVRVYLLTGITTTFKDANGTADSWNALEEPCKITWSYCNLASKPKFVYNGAEYEASDYEYLKAYAEYNGGHGEMLGSDGRPYTSLMAKDYFDKTLKIDITRLVEAGKATISDGKVNFAEDVKAEIVALSVGATTPLIGELDIKPYMNNCKPDVAKFGVLGSHENRDDCMFDDEEIYRVSISQSNSLTGGALITYEPAVELYGNTHILGAYSWVNDGTMVTIENYNNPDDEGKVKASNNNSYDKSVVERWTLIEGVGYYMNAYAAYAKNKNNELYSFKVNRPAEVIVLSRNFGFAGTKYLDVDGWKSIRFYEDGIVKIKLGNEISSYSFGVVKSFNADETVTIYSNNSDVQVMVRPID